MFNFFKKTPNNASAEIPNIKWTFISNLFHKISKLESTKERLIKSVELYIQIKKWEEEFDEECYELNFCRESMDDAFRCCTDFNTLIDAAIDYYDLGYLSKDVLLKMMQIKIKESDLPNHLKVRLFQTYIQNEFDNLKVDPREQLPELQEIFYEVEKRRLDDWDKERVLNQEFGIKNWKNLRDMNPDVIFD